MLAKKHRITSASDYKNVVRRGKRSFGSSAVTYLLVNPNGGSPRFGFIVSKKVGNAVVRNRVRRRLKASAHATLVNVPVGAEVVVRALPSSADASFESLHVEISAACAKLVRMASRSAADSTHDKRAEVTDQ